MKSFEERLRERDASFWERVRRGVSRAPDPKPEDAYRRGWQDGVFQVLDFVQERLREIREGAQAADAEWQKKPESKQWSIAKGEDGAEIVDVVHGVKTPRRVLAPNPDPRSRARLEMNLDELRAKVEDILRSPKPFA